MRHPCYISKTLQGTYADKRILDWRSHLGQLYYARYRDVPHGYISMKRHLDVNRHGLHQVRDLLDFRHQHLPRFVHQPEECGLLDAPSQVIHAKTVPLQVKHSSHEELAADRIGESTGLRMGDIVETLFPEQLHLVRLAPHQPILLQGPAGSGKTAIAQHRLAYLQHAQNGGLDTTRALILSPNELIVQYTASVLPELGVKAAQHTTVARWILGHLSQHLPVRNPKITDETYRTLHSSRTAEVKEQMVARAEALGKVELFDLTFTGLLTCLQHHLNVPAALIQQWQPLAAKHLPCHQWPGMEKIPNFMEVLEFMYSTPNVLRALLKHSHLESHFKDYFVENWDFIRIDVTELPRLMALHYALHGVDHPEYLMVDEAQDWPPLFYRILRPLTLGGRVMVMGDIHQAIHSYRGTKSWNDIRKALGLQSHHFYHLHTTYRSTRQITEFCNRIAETYTTDRRLLPSAFQRLGPAVKYFQTQNLQDLEQVLEVYHQAVQQGHQQIAIIAHKNADLEKLRIFLKDHGVEAYRVKDASKTYLGGTVLLTIAEAKGMEFESVIIHGIPERGRDDLYLRHLYVAATRALHQLTLLGEPRTLPFMG